VAAHLVSWSAACGVILFSGLVRISVECARRRTLVAIVTKAPADTVVVRESGRGGPAMWVRAGAGHTPPRCPGPGDG